MQRRAFLSTLGTLAIANGCLTACQAQMPTTLRVRALKRSIPPQLVTDFTKSIQPSPEVESIVENQLSELAELLKLWRKEGQAEAKGAKIPFVPAAKDATYIPDLVSTGDTWLPQLIKEKSIRPIDPSSLRNWSKLDPRWLELVRRSDNGDRSDNGKLWGMPYRWGTMLIVYRRDLLAQNKIKPPADWADLWRTEFQQRIAVPDDPRSTIGFTIKKIGEKYNSQNIDRLTELPTELAKLHRQVKFYSSDYYLQSLAIGDAWVAVGWSGDIIDLVSKNSNYAAVIPPSGTALWADLWVQPAAIATPNPDRLKLAHQWIDYCWQPQTSDRLAIYASSASPILTNTPPNSLITNLQQNALILPPKAILDRSEFLYPLSADDEKSYARLWQQMRNS
jgi:putative spermidine/putrescine transport system substrate-binding protein